MKKIYYYRLLFVILLFPFQIYAGEFYGSQYEPTISQFVGLNFQSSQEKRRKFEEDHGINGVSVKLFNETNIDRDDVKQILVLPFHFMHLRQTLQFLFLLASEDEYLQIKTIDDKIDWILMVAHDLSIVHPRAFGNNLNTRGFIEAAVQGRETLEQMILFSKTNMGYRSREQTIESIFSIFSQYYLLKFVREFEPSDRLGYDPKHQTLAIIDDGEHDLMTTRRTWVNRDLSEAKRISTPKPKSRFGLETPYMPALDIYSRMTIDFTGVEPRIAIPITPDMNDWQTDWPDSAGIRFFIKGKAYDIYFPVKWSTFHTDLAPEHLNLDRNARSFWGFGANDLSNLNLTPDGIRYFKSLRGSAIDMANNSHNFGYYPLQTPKLIKAFSRRPLHRIWSINNSDGNGGSKPSRIISVQKDESCNNLEDAFNKFDCMPRFEFLWDARSSFFPEHHVSDLNYYLGRDRTSRPVWKFPDHSFSPHVPIEFIETPAGFLRVLQKVDGIKEAFSLEYPKKDSEKISVPAKLYRQKRFSKKIFFGLTLCGLSLGAVGQFIVARRDRTQTIAEPKTDEKLSQRHRDIVGSGTIGKLKDSTKDMNNSKSQDTESDGESTDKSKDTNISKSHVDKDENKNLN